MVRVALVDGSGHEFEIEYKTGVAIATGRDAVLVKKAGGSTIAVIPLHRLIWAEVENA